MTMHTAPERPDLPGFDPVPATAVLGFDAPAFDPAAAMRDRVSEAAGLASRRRDRAYRDGHAEGLASAQREVDAAIDAHHRAAEQLGRTARALDEAIDRFEAADHTVLAELHDDLLRLAVAIAEELLGHELRHADTAVRDAIVRAARLAPGRGTPIVRVHPEDAAAASSALADGVVPDWTTSAQTVPDASVEPGGCVVEIDSCRIDAQLAPALRRVRAVLGADPIDETVDLLASTAESAPSGV